MLGRRKQAEVSTQGEIMALRSMEGKPLCSFSPEVVTSFRHMLTERTYQGGLPARIAMIAALREEGVTYTSLALGATLASDMAVKVCVVELNWWAPGMSRMLGQESVAEPVVSKERKEQGVASLPAQQGLAGVLMGAVSLDDALIKTELPNLVLLPAGDLPPAQRHILARSSSLKAMIDELGGRFDHLILDVPAVLLTSDAIALSALGDASCIVIRQGVTQAASVRRALDNVKSNSMLGVVLNQSSLKTPRWLLNLIPQE